MGIVYKARQIRPNRLVAIKVMRANALPKELDRFRREAEAVAAVQHPHIVQIHEVGETGGQLYFSMEYVPGGSLDKAIAGVPQPGRPAAQFLEWVARAVHCAHQQKIIHRDLKPANILLQKPGSRPASLDNEKATVGAAATSVLQPITDYSPKITDFGLAKRLDELGQTQSGELLGTPSYMAPEQAWGRIKDIGPRTDVYALGAILYELLTGRPPHRGENMLETLDQVRTQEPLPPSRLQPRLPRDLSTICLKALSKSPDRRYATAEAMADDLRRWLDGKPIQARAVGRAEKAWRWCRRNPVVAALTGIVILVSLVGIGSVLSQWLRAERAAATALSERDKAKLEAARALKNFDTAQEAVDTMLSRVGSKWLADVPHMMTVRREILEDAIRFQQRFLQESDDPAIRAEAGDAYFRVGTICSMLGQNEDAAAAFLRAKTLYEGLAAELPSRPEFARKMLGSWVEIANIGVAAQRFDEVRGIYEHLQTLIPRFPETVQQSPLFQRALASMLHGMAYSDLHAKRPDQAMERCKEARSIWKSLQEKQREQVPIENLAAVTNTLAVSLKRLERRPEARIAYEEAANLQEQVVAKFPTSARANAELGTTYRNLALLCVELEVAAEAETRFCKARDVFQILSRDFPEIPNYRSELGLSLAGIASVRISRGDLSVGREILQEAIEQQKLALKPDPPNVRYRRFLCEHLRDFIRASVDMKDHRAASKASLEWADIGIDKYCFHFPAQMTVSCMSLAEKDVTLDDSARQEFVHRYAHQAIQILRMGLEKRFLHAEHFKADRQLDPLRSYSEFRDLEREYSSKH